MKLLKARYLPTSATRMHNIFNFNSYMYIWDHMEVIDTP